MGKSNNPQPGHSLADAGAAACHAQVLPSKLPGVPTSQPQPSSFPASSSTKPFTQPKPSSVSALGHASSSSLSISPLTATLSSSPVPVYPDTNLDFVPPLSPTDDDDIFYDAEDNLFEVPPAVSVKPVRASGVQQVQAEPFLEGASKGRMGVSAPRATARSGPYPCTPVPVYSPLPTVRGSSKPSVSLSAAQPPPTPLASRVPSLFASPLSSSLTAQRQPIKRALLIGINYHNLHETKRLQHATKDARRFGATLAEAASFKEIQLITDDNALGPPPTRENILQRFDWLVRDAKAGDQLVVLFSGHCAYVNKTGPYLVAAGNSLISKEDLAHRLLSKLPAQCKLNLILDCCHSAAFVDLQYCVGKMGHELESEVLVEGTPVEMHAEPQRALSNPTQAPAPVAPVVKSGPILPPERSSPHLASLNGIHIPEDDPPPAPPPIAAKLGMDSFVSPSRPATPGPTGHRPPKRTGGVVAAPPLASTAPAEPGIGASMFASFINAATSTSLTKNTAAPVTSGETRKMRQPVVEGPREQDYFKERTEGFVKPLGEVTVWAAAGANQLAFEASGGVENGVVTNALCSALAACGGKIPTRREVWRYLTSSLETENTQRGNRDQAKAEPPDRAKRIQHAELWVSQAQPLSSAAPILDVPAF